MKTDKNSRTTTTEGTQPKPELTVPDNNTNAQDTPQSIEEFFGPAIVSITRKQLLAEGAQVDVSEMAKEAGFRIPVFMTDTVFNAYVKVPLVVIGIIVGLLLFDLPAGILFVISMGMSSKIASEQQAAIYSRYLDALDAKIEQEYLENAILGKCPTEITQLHKPLSGALNEDLRKNIAAAAVGKSVKIVTKGPNRAATP